MDNKEIQGTRINKFISDYGFCSRREADQLIIDERVTINNRPAQPGDRVTDSDTVRIDGETLMYIPKEARPKKHRWGPPRVATDDGETTAKRNAGSRGAARNSRKTAQPAKSAVIKTTKAPKAKSNKPRNAAPVNSKKRK